MRLSCTLAASLLALSIAVPALADAGATVAKLRVNGEKDRAEVVVDGTFSVPAYSINAELLRFDAIARFPEVQQALRPPLFSSNRIRSTVITRSTDLHIS